MDTNDSRIAAQAKRGLATDSDARLSVSRRGFLGALGAGALLTLYPRFASAAAPADHRLLVVLLRGAMDGLHLLPPRADPAYARLRGAIAVNDPLVLDGSFGLHPKLPFAHGLYAQKQLLPVLAVAPPYRQRSHFDAQDCLENGTDRPGGARDGWIGRCIDALSDRPSAARGRAGGVAIAQVMPLAMRGSAQSEIWSPPLPRALDEEMLRQLQPLYAADPQLAAAYADAMMADEAMESMPMNSMFADSMLVDGMTMNGMTMDGTSAERMTSERMPRERTPGSRASNDANARARAARGRFGLTQAMAAAAKQMHGAEGARIAFVEDTGWDTHRGQVAALDRKFGELDQGLRAVRDGLGADWAKTVVVVVTEFGRTAAVNGSAGTDHGVGGHALLAGGAVRGGRILGDWPGLSGGALLDGRDLRPTADLRAVFKGVLAAHLRVPEAALDRTIFPESAAIAPMSGLIAS